MITRRTDPQLLTISQHAVLGAVTGLLDGVTPIFVMANQLPTQNERPIAFGQAFDDLQRSFKEQFGLNIGVQEVDYAALLANP